MSSRYSLVLISALSLMVCVSATADINLTNGADLNMNGSSGSTIIFEDGSVQETAQVQGPQGDPGAVGPVGPAGPAGPAGATGADGPAGPAGAAGATGSDGVDGSDAAVPTGHGGINNIVTGTQAFVGGGEDNEASGNYATVGGGYFNTANSYRSTVGGGYTNTASATSSTVGGGISNTASGYYSMVGGGYSNTASGDSSTVGGGFINTASGVNSTVPGGYNNVASGLSSFAAGKDANATHDNSFVWADENGGTSFGVNTFNVHSTGIYLNGVVQHSSDRNLKEGFMAIDAQDVLIKVLDIPITSWRFKSEEDSVTHIGPVAQDFMASFGYGNSDKHITSTDADGVALAAIQGLNQKLTQELAEKQVEINNLHKRLEQLEKIVLSMNELQ